MKNREKERLRLYEYVCMNHKIAILLVSYLCITINKDVNILGESVYYSY